jgi:hypothetical protein
MLKLKRDTVALVCLVVGILVLALLYLGAAVAGLILFV